MNKIIYIISFLFLSLLLHSCSNSKHLPAGETLFKGSKVNITDNLANAKQKKVMRGDLAELVRPRPNSKTLGVRVKLTLYNMAGDPKKSNRLRRWLREKAGEAPVLTSSVNLKTNEALMVNHLHNKGFFRAMASSRIDTTKRRKASAVFTIATGPQYTVNEVYFKKDSSRIAFDIDTNFHRSLLKPGIPYNLDLIKGERNRIDQVLKNKGYFFFQDNYILVVVDSSIGDHKVNMYVRLKHREIPPEVYNVYNINDIYIYANYRLGGKRQDTSKADTVGIDSYYVVDKKKSFKPKVFARAMVFEKGDLYNIDDQNTSLSRLVNMGNFKFVKNRFEPIGDSLLDVYYYLTPFPKKSLRFEIGALTQNDNRAGSKASVSWRNRNVLRGAEELTFRVSGGFEAQYSGPVKQPNIYNFGVETNLTFPRFVIPFIDVNTNTRYLPRTVMRLKYNYESAAKLLTINSYNASYGYSWKEGMHKEHQLFPFNFTYVKTDTLSRTDGLGLNYGSLIFNGIIIGPTYQFTYNSSSGLGGRNAIYFDGLVDVSGNVLGLVQKANYETNPKTLFGSTYAQYVKLQPDFRYYLRLSKGTIIANRVLAGIGIPYGNSYAMPNIKQFWAGGNSDLRGFPSRLVGPGTFNEYESGKPRQFLQTLGDLKLELNVELRKNIYKFVNAGVFVDAGNIWLYRNNAAFPGGTISKNFYKELAANTGFGLRFDFKILILRLDLGMPIRKPWLPENDRWVLDDINFKDKTWRKNNLIFNIAIGYPF